LSGQSSPCSVLVETAGTPEQRGTVDQPDRQAGIGHARGEDAQRARAHEIVDGSLDGHRTGSFYGAGIAGHREAHLDAHRGRRGRERGAHVGKAAGLGQRIDLR
jgi:hypothetical protein